MKIKGILFYTILTITLIVCLGADYYQRKEMENDILNTTGPPPAIGSQAPYFKIMDKEKNIISRDSLLEDKYLIIFFTYTCEPSKNLLTLLSNFSSQLKSNQIQVLPIMIETTSKNSEEMSVEKNIDFPVYEDYKKQSKWAFNVDSYPSMYLIDDKGNIVYRQKGFDEDAIKTFIKNYLN